MIVLQVQTADPATAFLERDAPIAGYRNTPFVTPVARKSMDMSARWRLGNKAINVLGQDQHSQHIAHPVDQILRQETSVIFFKKMAQSAVTDGVNDHITNCTVSAFTTQEFLLLGLPVWA